MHATNNLSMPNIDPLKNRNRADMKDQRNKSLESIKVSANKEQDRMIYVKIKIKITNQQFN